MISFLACPGASSWVYQTATGRRTTRHPALRACPRVLSDPLTFLTHRRLHIRPMELRNDPARITAERRVLLAAQRYAALTQPSLSSYFEGDGCTALAGSDAGKEPPISRALSLASVSRSFLIASRNASEYSSNGAGLNLSFIQIVLLILSWFSMFRMHSVYQFVGARREPFKRVERRLDISYARSLSAKFAPPSLRPARPEFAYHNSY